MKKFDIFLEVASRLNKSLSVKPILYGSLGLRMVLKTNIKINDIDILIPRKFLDSEWRNLKKIMKEMKFKLKDLKEHEFIRNKEIVALGSDKALRDVCLAPDDLNETAVNGVIFRELTAQQYLKVYRYTLHDGYRLAKHSDRKKIHLLEKYLSNK